MSWPLLSIGRGGADVRARRHRGDVRGEGDERARTGRAATRRADPDDHRQRCVEHAS